MIPPFPLLKPAPTDLYTEIRERIPNKILQILRISQISQYTEVKSKNTTKKSKDLQGFHRYILKHPQNMNLTMHIPVTYCKSKHQTNTDQLLSSKMRKYMICITFGSQY